jgi:hypothetical protein
VTETEWIVEKKRNTKKKRKNGWFLHLATTDKLRTTIAAKANSSKNYKTSAVNNISRTRL